MYSALSRLGGALCAALVLVPTIPSAARAQRILTACTPDALAVCTEFRLTAGTGSFELALRTVGAASAALPVSVYNVVFGTGRAPAATPATTNVTPVATGGATVSDARPWELFDSGDALFLSALTNRGVSGCATAPDVGGFGQAARTCGVGQFVTFTFTPTALFRPEQFTLLSIESVVLTAPLQAASCGGSGAACRITADVVIPEPTSSALVAAGGAVLAALYRRRSGAPRRARG